MRFLKMIALDTENIFSGAMPYSKPGNEAAAQETELPLPDDDRPAGRMPVTAEQQDEEAWNEAEGIAEGGKLLRRIVGTHVLDDRPHDAEHQDGEQD